jgi:hypothetical protein
LNYNQTKNIWFLDGTFEIDQNSALLCSIVDDGAFPVSPSNTPTQTPTPSVTVGLTPTATQTPTQTPTNTQTQTPTNTNTQTQTPTNTNTPTDNVTDTPTPTPTQTPTPSVTATGTQTPTPTTTQTQTPTTTTTLTASETVTPTTTQTQTPTDTPEVSSTTTPTQTQTPTVTTTQTVTPSITASPTPSSFGINTFKVTMINTARSIFNSYTLTQIPYFVTPGVGFTGTTGTYPLSATTVSSETAYGTHSAFVFGNVVSFEVSSTGSNSATMFLTVNGTTSTSNVYPIAAGANTLDWTIANSYSSSDTLEFRIQ